VANETYTPNEGPWVELPPPTSTNWDFGERVGSLVYRINPTTLVYWNPDVAGRGFLFGGLGFNATAVGIFTVMITWASGSIAPPDDVLLPLVFWVLTACFVFGSWLSARKALPPPTFFNRQRQRVLQYQKAPGRKAEWLDWEWSSITPAVRQVHVYSSAGRSTMYVLVLMQLEKGTNKILRSFSAYSSVAQKQPCVAAWEYMRRYMNEPPERVPAAYIPPFGFDQKTWAVRCQIESMQMGMNADGTFRNWFARLLMPIAGTVLYPFIWATLWIEKTAPKIALPPELAKLNAWDEQQPNPYKIEYAYGGHDAENPVGTVYKRIKTRHWVMTVLGFAFYGQLLVTMLVYGWAGTIGKA
jgi:hypothetical protein